MSKVLKIAAEVVGAVALIATGVGAAVGAGVLGSVAAGATAATFAGVTAATFTAVGAIAGAAAAILSLGAAALTRAPSVTQSGNQDKFTASLDQGVPIALGRTAVSGFLVHRQTWDWSGSTPPNAFQTFFGVWSGAGPIKGIEAFQVDSATVTFGGSDGTVAQGGFNDGHNTGWMWLETQLGHTPEPAALKATGFYPYPAGWTASSKMSGYAAFAWTLKFDASGKVYPGAAVPQPRAVLNGVLAWDPRKDDTYPGGAGPQRAADPKTWDFTENPFILGLQWARGWFENGIRVAGIGMALAAIDVPSAVYAANVSDANVWKAGGVVYSTDGKWDVLKKICTAGSGQPLQLGGVLSFEIDTPRVSLATITDDDIIGKCTVPGAPRMVDRINGCIPTYREESQDWQLVPAAKVSVAAYVAADRRTRTKAITWELVQQVAQVGQLAAYAICNSREIDGIVMPLKLRWIGYKPGDALTVASSTIGLESQLIVVRQRSLDPASAAVTITARSETTGKHAFALGQSTTPPPAPALQAVDRAELIQPGLDAAWSRVADDDGGRPADHADVTLTALPAAYETFTGRDAKDVVDDLGHVTDGIASETMRAAIWRGESDQLLYMPDGRAVRTVVQAIGSTVDGVTQFVGFLQEVDTDTGVSKFLLSAKSDGSIIGIEGLAGGSTDQLSFVASKFLFADDTGANRINALTYEGGVWRLKSIEVDTIAADTITTKHLVVGSVTTSARTLSSGTLTGNGGWQQAASVTLPAGYAGQCDFFGQMDQGYASGTRGWGIRLLLNGVVLKTIQRSNPDAYTEILTILRAGVDLPAGQSTTVSLECLGADGTVSASNADLAAIVRFA